MQEKLAQEARIGVVLAAANVEISPTGGARAASGWFRDDRVVIALMLGVHIVAWTLYGVLALGVGLVHDDMIEAWNWSQVPQFGYYKHPPLFAWVTWSWFQLFPIADWSFYLMSAVNSAIGLLGVAALARFFGLENHRATAVALMIVTPLCGFMALKYNANSVLIPIWPWASWALLRSLETRKPLHGFLLGLLTGLALLGKYYSLLLAVVFLAVSFLPRYRLSYYRTSAPYIALATAAVVVAPHVIWSVANDYPTIAYALSKFHYPFIQILGWAAMTAVAPLLFLCNPVVLVAVAGRRAVLAGLADIGHWLRSPDNKALAWIAGLPFLLTIGCGFVGHAKVSQSYTIPIFFMAPLVILAAVPVARGPAVRRWAIRAALALMVGVIIAAPVIGYRRMQAGNEIAVAPIRELSREASRIWREATGRPLQIVASSDRFIGAIGFYGADHPIFFVNFNRKQAAWVSLDQLAREGYMAICRTGSTSCLALAERHVPAGARRITHALTHTAMGVTSAPTSYVMILVPPSSLGEKPKP